MEEHLSKLKLKPKPKKKEYQPIIIRNKNEEDIQNNERNMNEEKNTILINKINENLINRNDFIKKLKESGKHNIIENEKGPVISDQKEKEKEKGKGKRN